MPMVAASIAAKWWAELLRSWSPQLDIESNMRFELALTVVLDRELTTKERVIVCPTQLLLAEAGATAGVDVEAIKGGAMMDVSRDFIEAKRSFKLPYITIFRRVEVPAEGGPDATTH